MDRGAARYRARNYPAIAGLPQVVLLVDSHRTKHGIRPSDVLARRTPGGSTDQKIILFREYIDDVAFVCHEIPLLASELRSDEFETYVWSSHPVGEDIAVTLTGTELTGEVLKQINGQAVVVRKSDGTKLELNSPVAGE